MFPNKTNSSLWLCFHETNRFTSNFWDIECILCRLGGVIILCLSIICLVFDTRYFLWYQQRRHRNPLILSLILASFFILMISVPTVILQLLSCRQHCNEILCHIEGFTSYFSGCLCMLIYMMLSIYRYLSLFQYKSSLFLYCSAISCWIMSLIWTLPPVFDYWISYVPEGLGFHCSINWNDHSITSYYYILSAFVGMYLIPLLILLFVNVRVHRFVQNIYFYQNYDQLKEKLSNHSSSKQRKSGFSEQVDSQLNIISTYVKKAADRKRLRLEYRVIQAIIFLVGTYIFAWTPYSIIAILQLLHVEFIFQHAVIITLSAFIAKSSVIFTPFVYLYIMNGRLFKKLLFQF